MKKQRRIILENANNFRDLGGYATNDGLTTRWHRLYRSDVLAFLSEADWARLVDMGVRTVIDLRGSEENQQLSVTPPAEISYVPIKLIADKPLIDRKQKNEELKKALDSGRSLILGQDEGPSDGENDSSFIASLVMDYSVIFSKYTSGVAQVMNAINDGLDRGAVVFFCSAGKDRTGITAATCLSLCGVDNTDIVADYMVTKIYDSDAKRGVFSRLMDKVDLSAYGGVIPEPLVQSNPETMWELLEYYEANDMPGLLDKNGFSYEKQEELKGKLVE